MAKLAAPFTARGGRRRFAHLAAAALTLAACAGVFWAWGAGALSGAPMSAEEAARRAGELQRAAIRGEHAAFTNGRPVNETRSLALGRGETLGAGLQRIGVSGADARAATSALAAVFNPRHAQAGLDFDVFVQPGSPVQLTALAFKPSPGAIITVSRVGPNQFRARQIETPLTFEIARIAGSVQDSLFESATQLGATPRELNQLSDVFSYEVDFQRDIDKGAPFELVFERFYDDEGRTVRTGDMLFVSLQTQRGNKVYYRFRAPRDASSDWYDAEGRTARRALMRTPIAGARLSSGFGYRRHPVLGFGRMHQGIDFAAPVGTPIFAAGDGTVRQANYSGGYGFAVKIAHSGELHTLYGHMSRFASGIRPGVRVRQGQIIGYVGNTGLSTGPHLHFEVHVKGNPVNPLTIRTQTGRNLVGSDLAAFQAARARIDALRAARVAGSEPDPATLAALTPTAGRRR